MNTPRTIPDYLQALRAALRDADPALQQDALYDAEEYLRAELAARPAVDEAELMREMCASYGAPDEVAAIYTDREQQVALALNPAPLRRPEDATSPSWYRRFFGVALEQRTYGAVLYMLLALPLGLFYFAWAMSGVALSVALAPLIVGLPLAVLFISTVYLLSLLEGRLVEALLGERMPRRPATPPQTSKLLQRVGPMLADRRTWSTLLYMLLQLPLGTLYFMLTLTLLMLSLGLAVGGVAELLGFDGAFEGDIVLGGLPRAMSPLVVVAGIGLFFATLHLLRGLGRLHAALAKALLVLRPQPR